MDSLLLAMVKILMGIFLIVAYSKIAENTVGLSSGSNVVRANKGIFTIGVTFIVSGISFAICNHKCKCENILPGSNVYLGFFLLLGIVLTALAGVIIGGVSGSAKTVATLVLVLGLLFVCACIGFFVYTHRDKFTSTSNTGLSFSFF